MKLVFVQEPRNPFSLIAWNTADTAESLRDQGFQCECVLLNEKAMKLDADVFIFYRTPTLDSVMKMQELQARGKLCGFFIDDLVWKPEYDFAYHDLHAKAVPVFFEKSDFLLFTSEHLAKYAPVGKKVFIRRPGILERRFRELVFLSDEQRHKYANPFRILISKGHITREFKEMIKAIFASVEVLEPIDVFYFSVEELFSSLGHNIRVHRLNPLDFDPYLRKIAELSPDLVLCPFRKTEFNDCKCYPKYLETGGIGSALLVSDIVPYRAVIDHTINGLLSVDDDELSGYLSFALKNRGWLLELGLAARKDVEQNHLLGPIAKNFYLELKSFWEKK